MAINRSRVSSDPIPSTPDVTLLEFTPRGLVPRVGTSSYFLPRSPNPGVRWKSEEIHDESGPKTRRVRPCNSCKAECFDPGTDFGTFVDTPFPTQCYDGPIGHVPPGVPSLRGNSTDAIGESFYRRTLRQVKDEIPVQVSLPNFLLEIPDIPKTLTTISKLLVRTNLAGKATTLPELLAHTRRDLRFRYAGIGLRARKRLRFKPKRWSEISAEQWLNTQFGVLPTMSDLVDSLGYLTGIQKRIDYLVKTRGKPTRFRKSFQYRQVGETHRDGSHVRIPPRDKYREEWTRLDRFEAGGTFTHNLVGLTDVGSRINAYLDGLGFANPASTLWEALPLSWLVDYLANISDILKDLDMGNAFDGDIVLSDTWHTKKVTQYTILYVRHPTMRERVWYPPYEIIHYGDWQLAGSTFVETFERACGIPYGIGQVWDPNRISATKIANAVALIV